MTVKLQLTVYRLQITVFKNLPSSVSRMWRGKQHAFLGSYIDRQIDKQTDRQRDRETERQRDRETERQRDKETERQRDREREGYERNKRDC